MSATSVVIIGAGQAGLAMSRALSELAIDHLVLERGSIGQSWKAQRWDSLRLLTPNWANRLPGQAYDPADSHGFMAAKTFAGQLDDYAQCIGAPVQVNTHVHRVSADTQAIRVETDTGDIRCKAVVVATGAASVVRVPGLAADIPRTVHQTTADRYRNPSDLPSGPVLVVGASASGVQLARELRLAGHDVILSVGNHLRLPRRYRGHDIEHWLDVTGVLDQLTSELPDLGRARRVPSPQLIGGANDVDLNALQALGIELVGRLSMVRDGQALFSGGLAHLTASADLKMNRLLDETDQWIAEQGLPFELDEHPDPTRLPRSPRLSVKLDDGSIRSIVWATGFAPDFSFLNLPVFNPRGQLQHDGGVCPIPGLYVLGLPLLRRRRSHQISGVGSDARDLGAHIANLLGARRAA